MPRQIEFCNDCSSPVYVEDNAPGGCRCSQRDIYVLLAQQRLQNQRQLQGVERVVVGSSSRHARLPVSFREEDPVPALQNLWDPPPEYRPIERPAERPTNGDPALWAAVHSLQREISNLRRQIEGTLPAPPPRLPRVEIGISEQEILGRVFRGRNPLPPPEPSLSSSKSKSAFVLAEEIQDRLKIPTIYDHILEEEDADPV